MNNNDYSILKRVFKQKKEISTPIIINQLIDIQKRVNPFIKYHISNVINKQVPKQNDKFLRQRFSTIEENDTYLNELVITFLQYVGRIIMNNKLVKLFYVPNVDTPEDMEKMLQYLILSVVTLIYNKETWSVQDYIALNITVSELIKGKPEIIGQFLININVIEKIPHILEYESKFYDSIILTQLNWGPLVWRMIHVMAECIKIRSNSSENIKYCKTLWREFTVNSLHRILLCGMCQNNYNELLKEYKNEIINKNDDEFPYLWFELHNQVKNHTYSPHMSILDFSEEQKIIEKLLTM